MRPLLPALTLLALASVARAEWIVLEPVDSGTREYNLTGVFDANGKFLYYDTGFTYDRAKLVTGGYANGNVYRRTKVVRAEFDLSALPAQATVISARYSSRRATSTHKASSDVFAYAGNGSISGANIRSGTTQPVTEAVALAGFSLDFASAVQNIRAAYTRYVGFETRDTTSYAGEDTWMRTGVDRPTLTIEYAPAVATFTSLGSLQSRGFYSSARALSSDGSTVIGVTDSVTGDRAFVWSAARGMFDIGAGAAGASGVSGDGKVVVGTTNPGGYRWLEDGTGTWLGSDAVAYATSPDASAVVGSSLGGGIRRVFRWTSTSTESYPTYVGSREVPAQASAVSANGSVFVGATLPYAGAAVPTRAFVWTNTGEQFAIPALPGGTGESQALGVSGNGTTVVGWSRGKNGPEAFLWTSQRGVVGLGNLKNPDGTLGNASRANAIAPYNSVIVGAAVSGGKNRAMIWDGVNGMQDLQTLLASRGASSALAGWTLFDATGVVTKPDGKIIVTGTGRDPWGRTQAFYATLPSTTPGTGN